MKRTTKQWDSGVNDSGILLSKGKSGTVENNMGQSRKKRRKEPSHFQKVELNWNMIKEIMPRMKAKSWLMFDHYIGTRGNSQSIEDKFSNFEDSTALVLAWPSFGHFYDEDPHQNRIASGHSMTVKDTTDNSELVSNCIFPIGHPALIIKGDDIDQRLGDMVNIKGLRIRGVIESFLTYPSYDNSAVETLFPKVEPVRAVGSSLDNRRKVRLMIVEAHDVQLGSTTTFNDDQFYVGSVWPPTIRGSQAMNVINAPRLENILEVPATSDGSTSADPQHARSGRWQGIDRHYRSNKDSRNVWQDPVTGRTVAFRVMHDVSFNLAAPPSEDFIDHVDGPRASHRSGHFVNIDILLKNLDWNESYAIDETGVNSEENGSRRIYLYLFDDSMDFVHTVAQSVTTLNTGAATSLIYSISDEVVRRGYARTRAKLYGNFFFNDSL